ncbi:hypothetical protein EPUL_002452 [Erysiphe pulchra]|uniref:Uncharacterized protein n=1 Tax=Erysiphe pulchra TaxID=225359 RepID=A0A2S4PS67_9PEZI|nr:hypothetical protein EPUL_002452 [Erysiphe pulchra]
MLAIKKGKVEKRKYTVNILPCLINHDGPFTTSKRYWNPVDQPDGLSVAFFRGKKLHGKRLRLPERYRKVVLSKTDETIPRKMQAFAENTTPTENEHIVEDEENDPIVKIVEEQCEFDDIMIWGHETLPDETTDPFVRGIQEWIDFSALLHTYDDDINDSESTSSVRC